MKIYNDEELVIPKWAATIFDICLTARLFVEYMWFPVFMLIIVALMVLEPDLVNALINSTPWWVMAATQQ